MNAIRIENRASPAPGARAAVWPLVSRFFADYRRNPVNLLLLVLVPVAFVVVASGSLAEAATLLGGPGGPAVEVNTARRPCSRWPPGPASTSPAALSPAR